MLEEERTDIKLCNCMEKCVVDGKYSLENVDSENKKATVKTGRIQNNMLGRRV